MTRILKTLMAIALFSVVLTGCQSTELTTQEMALVQAQMTRNTLEIDCPSGCSIKYRDPRDQVQLPQRHTWSQTFETGLVEGFRFLGGSADGYLVYRAGGKAVDGLVALGGHLSGSGAVTNTTHTTTTTTTTSTDQSIGDYSGAASGNSGQQYTDTSGRINSDDDYTSTPTVVQPVPGP